MHGPEIHHGLVEVARAVFGQERLCQGRELFLRCRGAHGRVDAVMPCQHAIDIAVDHGGGQAECDGTDGGRCVIAHAFQGADAFQRVGEGALLPDLSGGSKEVPSAAVVAEPFPEPQHLVFRCGSQRRDVGEPGHEAFPVGRSLGDPGLLEDDFAQPDGIGVARPAPGQVAAVDVIPAEDPFGEGGVLHLLQS